MYSFFYAIWGTSWTFPFININYSYLWFGTAILAVFFSNSKKVSFDEFLIIFLIVLWTILFFFIGIPDNLSSDKSSDFFYLVSYVLKVFLGIFLVFTFVHLFQSSEDLKLFFVSLSLFLIPIIFYLSYKYLIVYGLDFIGVQVDDNLRGTKTFKNSLATSVVLIMPFIFAGIFSGKNRFIFTIAFISVLFFLYYVNSRSAVIILFFEILFFFFLSQSERIKRNLRYVFISLIALIFISGISFSDWILKNNAFSDSGLPEYFQSNEENLLETHRGWLLIESFNGYLESSLMGNGIATFRIRPTNLDSRTDTHNDYALLLYEQGTIGFGLILFLIIWRISVNMKLLKKYNDRYLEASSCALVGLLISLIFVNLIQTLVFWTIIALSYVFSDIYNKKNLEKNKV